MKKKSFYIDFLRFAQINNQKTKIINCFLFVFLMAAFSSCNNDEKEVVTVASIAINTPAKTTLLTGESLTLSAVVLPDNAPRKDILWVSNRPTVASIDPNTGLIKALFPGEVKFTVTSKEGYKTDAVVFDIEAAVPTIGISLSISDFEMVAKDTLELKNIVSVNYNPSNASFPDVTWASNNTAVATVSVVKEKLIIAAIAQGEAVITATTIEGNNLKASFLINVEPLVPVPATGVTLAPAKTMMVVDDVLKLTATIAPAGATHRKLTWESNDTDVATVDDEGNVTAIAPGTVKITVTTVDGGFKASSDIEVIAIPPTDVKVNMIFATLKIGETLSLIAKITPENSDFKDVTWTSSAAAVASVDTEGNVTGLTEGKTIITVTTVFGGLKATCELEVIE